MEQNGQQNYWQPQDEPETQVEAPRATSTPKGDAARQRAIEWEASEVIESKRGPLWYIMLSAVVLIVSAVAFFLREWILGALILIVGVTVIVMSRRPARVVRYNLSDEGLMIDGKMRPYSEFRAFGIVKDGAFFAIKLIPIHRFSPETTVYFEQKDGEAIVDVLGGYLPMEDMKLSLIDKITRKLGL